jgi:hypothetical protein
MIACRTWWNTEAFSCLPKAGATPENTARAVRGLCGVCRLFKAEILRGIRRNYAADALRMTFYSLYVINYLPVLQDDCSED